MVSQDDLLKWSHLRDIAHNINLPNAHLAGEVHLLIGLDQPDILAPREVCRGDQGEPYATLSGLGWTLNGPTVDNSSNEVSVNHIYADDSSMTRLNHLVEGFWKLEDPVHLNDQAPSVTDREVVNLWNQEAMKEGAHYVLPIPFKEKPPKLENNYSMAKHRLDLLGKRLKREPTLQRMYTAGIQESLQKGYAEEVTNFERSDGGVWYLPHHPVLHPKKPGKVRIVFDCAAKYRGTALNDCIHQGPDLTNKLLGVLLKFRQQPVALSADIEGMFCQVRVPPKERDVLRFLWWADDDPDKPVKLYRMTTHLFGGVWSPSAANFALRKVAEHNQGIFSDDTIQTLLHNFYVDDCLKAVATKDQAIRLATELQELLASGGFRLTKWLCNSKRVMRSIPAEEWSKSLNKCNLDHDDLPCERALGVLWDVEQDTFIFDIKLPERPTSKRGMLSTTSSVYDPLGFASPFVFKAKVLFQESTRPKMDWDEELPDKLATAWHKWLTDLPLLSELAVTRCLMPPDGDPSTVVHLHHFSDASERGYGAVTYIKINDKCNLVMAKAKLAPIKPTSIPRLELLGAVVATDLDLLVKRHLEIPIDKTYFWTDSTIVLQYINSDDCQFQTFVANRISKIRERSNPDQWRHVDSASNPADDISRGLTAGEMLSNKRWISGPAYLQLREEDWPTQPSIGNLPEDAEIKRAKGVYMATCTAPDSLEQLLQRYSDWHRMKRAVVILLRLKALLRKKAVKRLLEPITVEELRNAETAILCHVQHESFGSAQTKFSPITSLKPYSNKETKLLCVGGRLTKAPIPHEAKHPVILPTRHRVTELVIRHYHLRLGHMGAERVLAEIRQRFWIIKGRSTVSRVLKSCVVCRKQKAQPQNQQMADLPESRVTPDEPPFSRVGVDYFGPFMIKRARSELKRYGCLFTCLATRAIHLEVSNTLNTDSFINALQRFIARRGEPAEIRSDNGTNFVGGLQELRKAVSEWNQQRIADHLLQHNVRWIFNPPGASHMGGVWERQIRTIRSVLNGVTSLQLLDEEGLTTLFCTVEAIINGRPITKLSNDPKDPLPLTPNHLLLLRSGSVLPPGVFVKEDLYRRCWRQVQYLADQFWARWVKEYLPSLQQRQKWILPKRNLEEGDLVLILHEKTPRNSWPLGLITHTYPGPDGLVCTVQVKTASGVFDRPADKMCLLEANLVKQKRED